MVEYSSSPRSHVFFLSTPSDHTENEFTRLEFQCYECYECYEACKFELFSSRVAVSSLA